MILPRVWRDRDEPALREALERARSLGFTGALIGNIGHLPLVRGTGLRMYGDYGLNVFNARSLAYLRDKGLESACLSFELRSAQIRDMRKVLPAEAVVYGRLPLMITENCLIQNGIGCSLDRTGACVPEDGPCRAGHVLTDRTGAEFPLLPAYGHRTELQNAGRCIWRTGRSSGGWACPLPGCGSPPRRRRRARTSPGGTGTAHRRRAPSPGGSMSGAWSEGGPIGPGEFAGVRQWTPPPIFFSILLKRKRAADRSKRKGRFLSRFGTFVPPRGRGSPESVPVKTAGLLPARAGPFSCPGLAPRVRCVSHRGGKSHGPCS